MKLWAGSSTSSSSLHTHSEKCVAFRKADPGALGRADPGALRTAEPGALGKPEPGALRGTEPGVLRRAEPGALGKREPGVFRKSEPGTHAALVSPMQKRASNHKTDVDSNICRVGFLVLVFLYTRKHERDHYFQKNLFLGSL